MEAIRKIFISLIIYGFLLFFLVLFLNDAIRLDEYLFFLINSSTNSYLLIIFNLITYLGSTLFWIFLIILFWLDNKRKLSLHLLYAFIIDSISLFVLKQFFLRPRPSEVFQVMDIDIGPSFPSGHSQRAFSGAVALSHYYKKYRYLFYALATLVSFSRIYIGFHYPLDVLIGAINGTIIGMIVLTPVKNINFRKLTRLLGYKN